MFNKDKFLKDLEELVNIDCGTYNAAGTAKIVSILEGKFHKLGFKTKKIDVGNEVGPLLVACNKEFDGNFDALLIGHTDTVYPEGLASKHPMTVKGNKVYGLGTIDMKSGILQGLYAIENLNKAILDKLSLCFVCNPDEEISSEYSGDEIIKYAKLAKCVLVLEAGIDATKIVNKRKGITQYVAKFKGKACHASLPHLGASAVQAMARFIIKLEEFYNPELNTTFNAAPLSGGTVGNVVPENAELEFEVRFLDNEIAQKMKARIHEFANNPEVDGVTITIEEKTSKPALINSKENQWIEQLVVKEAKAMGLNLELVTSGGGSDGNELSAIGIATIDGLGPLGGNMHNENEEYLDIDSVETKMHLLERVLTKLSEK